MRLAVVAATFALLLATGATPAQADAQTARTETARAQTARTQTARTQTAEGRYAAQATAATNAHRVAQGLRALRTSTCLRRAAVRQAVRMAQREAIFHQDLGAVLQACHADLAGENVADGYPNGRSVVNDGWMHSEGHRANILDPSYTLIGIGARKGHNGRWYVSQVFGRRA